MIYLVTYELKPKRDATTILRELQNAPGWWHYMDNVWLIATRETAIELYNRIRQVFQIGDRILVMQFMSNAQYQGWLQKDAWDWITNTRNAGY